MRSVLVMLLVISCSLAEHYSIRTASLEDVDPAAVDTRIIGGQPATIERYPYTVQVLVQNQFNCGGSLITQRHVLSAAHCFVNSDTGNLMSPRLFTIRAGSAMLGTGGTVYGISTIVVHESYNRPLRDNDVAVLVTSSRVTLGRGVAVAIIPAAGQLLPDNATVTAVGWGATDANIQVASPILNEVQIRKVNLQTCFQRYLELQQQTGFPFPVTNNMLCAGLLDVGGRDACQGDSGGPLVISSSVGNIVVGITSWGYSCALPRYPGVSARVSSYTTWINRTVTRFNAGPALGPTNSVVLLTTLAFSTILARLM